MQRTYSSHPWGHISIVEHGDHVFVTARPSENAEKAEILRLVAEVAAAVSSRDAVPVHERIFGRESVLPFVEEARRDTYIKVGLDARGPVTSVDGVPAQGSGFSGLFIHAVVPHNECSRPELVFDGNTAVGRKWRSSVAEFLLIQNIGADFKATDSPTVQAENAFECMHRQIVSSGFSFQEVVRTWFYLTDILSWYGDFNKVRSASYRTCGIMPLPGQDVGLPSSTGIGCSHSNGRALAADVLLVRMQNGRRPNRIQNPAQKEAYKYGAAFSRAVEIKDRDSSLIEMSGTAAIDELGVSLYPNDAEAQINCTLDKIDVLLRRVGGTLQDIAQATVFVKHPDIALTFERIKAARGMKNFPSIIVHADICRAELLFEIDAEASVL